MQFLTESKNDLVQMAAMIASKIVHDEEFWATIPDDMLFDMSRGMDGKRVGKDFLKNAMQNTVAVIEVKTYRKRRNFWSRAIVVGYYNGGKTIYSNELACPTAAHFVGNFVHEGDHVVDNFIPEYLGHGNNNSKGKENTAAYYLGHKAKEYAQKVYKV